MSVQKDLCEICYADINAKRQHQTWCALGLSEARAAQLQAERDELARKLEQAQTALRDTRREFQTLVDDIVNFPGEFDRDSESVAAAVEYLAEH